MDKESKVRQMKLEEMINPRWVCVDADYCTEFGRTIEECIERYENSMGELNIKELTFYELKEPYEVEAIYILNRKKEEIK